MIFTRATELGISQILRAIGHKPLARAGNASTKNHRRHILNPPLQPITNHYRPFKTVNQ